MKKTKKQVKEVVLKKQIAVPETRIMSLRDLNPAVYNPREITDDAASGLSKSMKKYGCVEPIVVNVRGDKNVIVGGHQRHKQLLLAGEENGLCVIVDLSEKDEKLLNLSLNNPEIQGTFKDSLASFIDQLRESIEPTDFVDLRIAALRESLVEEKTEKDCVNKPVEVNALYQIVIECDSENQQTELFDELMKRNLKCRLLIL